ncbi:MAG: 2-oxoacid:acceptor oxidoreductase family protein [Candidatus Woesearchaeota archaeon]
MTKLVIKGLAGQGIKLVSWILVNILKDKGYQIAVTYEYSPLVRAGGSNAYIVFSKERIESPLIEEADFEYDLTDDNLQKDLSKKCEDKKLFINMILLGVLLRQLAVEFDEESIKKYLPKRFLKENLKAIRGGFE